MQNQNQQFLTSSLSSEEIELLYQQINKTIYKQTRNNSKGIETIL